MKVYSHKDEIYFLISDKVIDFETKEKVYLLADTKGKFFIISKSSFEELFTLM